MFAYRFMGHPSGFRVREGMGGEDPHPVGEVVGGARYVARFPTGADPSCDIPVPVLAQVAEGCALDLDCTVRAGGSHDVTLVEFPAALEVPLPGAIQQPFAVAGAVSREEP